MNNNKLKLYVLALIAFFIICALASCSSVDPTKRYARKYSDMSYQAVMKDSESFTVKSLKEDKKLLKEGMRNEKKKNGKNSKKDRLKKELEELRAKNN